MSYQQSEAQSKGIGAHSFYDSDAVEKFVLELEKPNSNGKLFLQKPDGGHSYLEFTSTKKVN
jgi:hypothetical protein